MSIYRKEIVTAYIRDRNKPEPSFRNTMLIGPFNRIMLHVYVGVVGPFHFSWEHFSSQSFKFSHNDMQ